MLRDSNNVRVVIYANNNGYIVTKTGEVITPKGNKRTLVPHGKGGINYYQFNIKVPWKRVATVQVHQLAAYQKFGEIALYVDVLIRHLDGDSLNNSYDNLAIGSYSDNMMDKAKEVRLAQSIIAATHTRVLTDLEIAEARKLRKEGYSYKELMLKYSIKSKGSMWEILNRAYVTKK